MTNESFCTIEKDTAKFILRAAILIRYITTLITCTVHNEKSKTIIRLNHSSCLQIDYHVLQQLLNSIQLHD